MLKDVLQGKPIRHPLHPLLVHFPIGFFVLSLLLDIAARIWPEFKGLTAGAYYSMAAGVIGALVAAVPGFVDYTDIRRDHPARKIATIHMLLNLLVVGIYAVNLGLRQFQEADSSPTSVPLFLSVIAVGVLSISGHLGGKMVFDDGMGVGRHRRKTRTPEETVRVSSTPREGTEDPFVKVGRAEKLAEGETLRVQLNGTVIVVACLEGQFFAFQEFCTHRFGPLSEGCLSAGEVECPWHRSRFDVRTGQVTKGPAKEHLKTFEVAIRKGDLYLNPEPRRSVGTNP